MLDFWWGATEGKCKCVICSSEKSPAESSSKSHGSGYSGTYDFGGNC